MSVKVIGANLKFNQNLRSRTGLSLYLADVGAHLGVVRRQLQGAPMPVVRVFPHILPLARGLRGFSFTDYVKGNPAIGVQDISPFEDGSFTSAPPSANDVVKVLELEHAMAGHSETVVFFGVKDADVAKKVDAGLKAGIHMTVCLGVMPDIAAKGEGDSALAKQVADRIIPGLSDAAKEGDASIFDIAWEPVAAIAGFAKLWGLDAVPPADADIVNSHAIVRDALSRAGFKALADAVHISYGGSAKPSNAEHLLKLEGVDGLLIGTASWEAESLNQMIDAAVKAGK